MNGQDYVRIGSMREKTGDIQTQLWGLRLGAVGIHGCMQSTRLESSDQDRTIEFSRIKF
jgi:hypothetical protein